MKKYINFDGMSFPNPDVIDDPAWRLNYGTPTRQDLMFAVSVMYAYNQLVMLDTQKTRNSKISRLRTLVKHLRTQKEEEQ